MVKVGDEASSLLAEAERIEARAERALQHAVLAHQESQSGDEQSATAHLREAQVHERTAELLQQTAALYRAHANRAAKSKAAGVPVGLASTLRRTAEALEHTARLAEQNAVRLEGSGQSDAAADEREQPSALMRPHSVLVRGPKASRWIPSSSVRSPQAVGLQEQKLCRASRKV